MFDITMWTDPTQPAFISCTELFNGCNGSVTSICDKYTLKIPSASPINNSQPVLSKRWVKVYETVHLLLQTYFIFSSLYTAVKEYYYQVYETMGYFWKCPIVSKEKLFIMPYTKNKSYPRNNFGNLFIKCIST